MAEPVTYAQGFFDLQVRLANRVATLSELSLARALMQYTNIYIRLGLGRDFDPAHPVWLEYLAGLPGATDHGEWTYRFYLARSPVVTPPHLVATFGCFSYSWFGNDRIRLHFQNSDSDGRSPLGLDRRDHRLAELAVLFAHVKHTIRQSSQVVGASWLYNLDAYRRLFPASYIATAQVIYRRFQHMPLWGQFLNRRGAVKQEMASRFLQRLDSLSTAETLDQCFPFQVLRVESSVLKFYEFYGV